MCRWRWHLSGWRVRDRSGEEVGTQRMGEKRETSDRGGVRGKRRQSEEENSERSEKAAELSREWQRKVVVVLGAHCCD